MEIQTTAVLFVCGELGCDKGSHKDTACNIYCILLFSDILEENKFAHLILFQFYQMKGHTGVKVELIQKYVALLDAGCRFLLYFLQFYIDIVSVQHKN